jgi:hypothetical protein
MTNQTEATNDEANGKGKLLSSQERQAFKMISAGDDLHGQRAIALLAIDEGATQKEAGIRSSLTPGQVKYWLGRFRQLRLEIFPDQVLENAGIEPEITASKEIQPAKQAAAKPKKSKGKKKKDEKKAARKKAKKSKKKGSKKKDKKSKKNKNKQKKKKS